MSGHSKWSSIKHKKAKMDAQRGKLFGRMIREITVAARRGGGSPDANPRLRAAIQTAKSVNMPAENITKAIKKGTGELPGVNYEECVYEGYGPGGVAMMVEVVTDNKNRIVSELKKIFGKCGGHLGASGCVSWLFHKKGLITVDRGNLSEDELMEIVLDAGAEDLRADGDTYVITSEPQNFEGLKATLSEKGIETTYAELTLVPENTVSVEGKTAEQVLRLAEALEECDDTQHVYANFDVPDEILEELTSH